ncbi:MAG: ABC transporter substrate-binding protein [Acidobacteriota bacterium]
MDCQIVPVDALKRCCVLVLLLTHSLASGSLWAQPAAGGRLVVGLKSEPRTLNPVFASDRASLTVNRLLHSDLIRIDRETQRPLSWLASRFESSPTTLDVELRPGLRFSDGQPLTVDDVLFSLRLYLDESVGSPYRELLAAGAEPPILERRPNGVRLRTGAPRAVMERVLDGLPILPRAALSERLDSGKLADSWGLGESKQVVGLGPFRVAEYSAGRFLRLERNPYYWRTDADGRALPLLDEVVFVFGDAAALAARFEQGEVDVLDGLSGQDFKLLEQRASSQRLVDLGAGLGYEFLFFNRNRPGPRPEAVRWFADTKFRKAISRAIDRKILVEAAYGGRAEPLSLHVSSGDRLWFDRASEAPRRSLAGARALLANAGYVLRDGRLHDPEGLAVVLNIVTNSSNRSRQQAASLIRQDLEELGIEVSVATLEFRSFLERIFEARDYDLAILGLARGDVDPNPDLNVFRTGGSNRVWELTGGAEEDAPWQPEIDRLLVEQRSMHEASARRAAYSRVLELLRQHEPVVFLVAPHVLVAASAGLGNFAPVVLGHPTLWNADELYWVDPNRRTRR